MPDTLKVLGGDFYKKDGWLIGSELHLHTKNSFLADIKYPGKMIAGLEVVTEENAPRLGWILATGGLAILRGPRKDVTVLITFRDGKKVLATMSSGTYKKVVASSL